VVEQLKGIHMKTIPILTSMSVDGTVTVSIEQVGYTYLIDGGFMPEIRRLFQYKPWMAVRLLKQKAYHYTKDTLQRRKEVTTHEV
jgi:hypothetical protein